MSIDTYTKRLQTKASRQGVKVSRSKVRAIYDEVVSDRNNPTEVEMGLCLGFLLEANRSTVETEATEIPEVETMEVAGLVVASSEPIEIEPPAITEITPESHPDVWEILQPPVEEPEPTQEPENQPQESTLVKADEATITPSSVTQDQIQLAVEEHFGKESVETKTAILDYVAKDTFTTATELSQALENLRKLKLDILMKIVRDHNSSTSSDEQLIKSALNEATRRRQEESEDFFKQFDEQLAGMRAAFGL
jgi:hypothetical protein